MIKVKKKTIIVAETNVLLWRIGFEPIITTINNNQNPRRRRYEWWQHTSNPHIYPTPSHSCSSSTHASRPALPPHSLLPTSSPSSSLHPLETSLPQFYDSQSQAQTTSVTIYANFLILRLRLAIIIMIIIMVWNNRHKWRRQRWWWW